MNRYMVTVGGFTYKGGLSIGQAYRVRRRLKGQVINIHVRPMKEGIG